MMFSENHLAARRAVLVLLAAAALGVFLSACGSSSSAATSTAASASSRSQARLDLARCLRAHGLNVPDPSPSGGPAGGGGLFRSLRNYPESQVTAAQQACRSYLVKAFPQLNLNPAQRAQVHQQLVKFAQCMRSHGIDIPDPNFNGGGGFGFGRAFRSVDRNSPAFQSASQACASLRPRFGRGGPGGAGA